MRTSARMVFSMLMSAPVLAADPLSEVVVTARKRADSLEGVPTPVGAIQGPLFGRMTPAGGLNLVTKRC